MIWRVIYTKPQMEIKVALSLRKMGINAYCPLIKQIKQYSDRKKTIEKPLLPSYVFVKVDNKNTNKVFLTPGVVRYVYWLGKPAIVKQCEIDLMEDNFKGIYKSVEFTSWKIGNSYELTHGIFKGQIGKLIQITKNKINLALPSLGIYVTINTV